MARLRLELRLLGAVQGIGFRPWAAREAARRGLGGHVRNAPGGVHLALEGSPEAIDAWLRALAAAPPAGARIERLDRREAPCRGEGAFRIEASRVGADRAPARPGPGDATAARVPPDAPLCAACLEELFDPGNRRHRYPFTHCAVCGPRAAVLLALPYDRERTTLGAFEPCAVCRCEYADAGDRRFHAQTIACADCGPRLRALEPDGREAAGDPMEAAAAVLRGGGIAAVKGYGGFHLACDATSAEAVARLRKRKARPVKPLAVLVPDLAAARALGRLDAGSASLLAGPLRAVTVVPRREDGVRALGLAPGVAPRTGDLGLLLPHAPLHWLLLFAPGSRPGRDAPRLPALVFTSANPSGEPTIHDNETARGKLSGIADLVVEHDRDVARPNDDSVFRSGPRRPIAIRLSRAAAPLALRLPPPLRDAPPLLALGGDLKCAPALAAGGEILLAEHLGDLASPDAVDALRRRAASLAAILGVTPRHVAHDRHPDYLGTALAEELGLPRVAVQHHHAHALACLVEAGVAGPALALVLDGAGYGEDGTIWGGELLRLEGAGFERLAHLERVPLPGGDAAAREPWRMAAMWLDRAFPLGAPRLRWRERRRERDLGNLRRIAARGTASPLTSSCGRLFDAVASLLDLGDHASHEGEAAAALETLAEKGRAAAVRAPGAAASAGEVAWKGAGRGEIPAADLIRDVADAMERGEPAASVAWRFHEALAARLAGAVIAAAAATGDRRVALSGGCFQNRLLLEGVRTRLERAGLAPLTHGRVPPNDGGLAVGQAVAAAWRLGRGGADA